MRANDTAGAPVPFQEFARGVQIQSALRERISEACRRPETECLPPLLNEASLPPADAEAARALARELVIALRRKKQDRPSRPPVLDGRAEARLIALACSAPPDGRTEWTMQLLADRLVQLQVVDAVSDETVRRVLKKTRSSRG